jgi:hypothetical protein
MKSSSELSRVRICSRDVRTFVPIAMQTGESEILKNSPASMLTCNDVIDVIDVIDVKRQWMDVSGKVTRLASALGSLPYLPDNIPFHE